MPYTLFLLSLFAVIYCPPHKDLHGLEHEKAPGENAVCTSSRCITNMPPHQNTTALCKSRRVLGDSTRVLMSMSTAEPPDATVTPISVHNTLSFCDRLQHSCIVYVYMGVEYAPLGLVQALLGVEQGKDAHAGVCHLCSSTNQSGLPRVICVLYCVR